MLDSSKFKDFADDNLRFEENDRKLLKLVENTVRKGEIARYEQFLLFPQCFQKACFPLASKGVIVWEWVKGAVLFFFLSFFNEPSSSPRIIPSKPSHNYGSIIIVDSLDLELYLSFHIQNFSNSKISSSMSACAG